MPQSAETLVRKKHERIMDKKTDSHPLNLRVQWLEHGRYFNELNSLNSPQIDRRPKK